MAACMLSLGLFCYNPWCFPTHFHMCYYLFDPPPFPENPGRFYCCHLTHRVIEVLKGLCLVKTSKWWDYD